MDRELKAVIFDMDGVLTATVEYHYLSWKTVTEARGIPFRREDNEKLLGLTRRRSLEVILQGRDLPEEEKQAILAQKNARFLELVEQMDRSDLHPGVERLLGELRAANLCIGVASASSNARRILKNLGIEEYFHAIGDANAIHRSKPAPDIFLHTAAALQVEPPECIAIEDSRPGIQAALSAGMCVIGLGPPERVGLAHAIYPDLARVHLCDLLNVHNMLNDRYGKIR